MVKSYWPKFNNTMIKMGVSLFQNWILEIKKIKEDLPFELCGEDNFNFDNKEQIKSYGI